MFVSLWWTSAPRKLPALLLGRPIGKVDVQRISDSGAVS